MRNIGNLRIGNISLADYKAMVTNAGLFKFINREAVVYHVPGKNGDLVYDNGNYENEPVEYPAFIYEDFERNFPRLRSQLSRMQADYFRISDEFITDQFRLGRLETISNIKFTPGAEKGSFVLAFSCKPQIFLTSGEAAVSFTADGTISNPTAFESKPLIRIYGTGTATIGNTQVTISTADGYTDIDSETMVCCKGTVDCSDHVSMTGNNFPTLAAGNNAVRLGTGITQVKITPRWWTR